MVDIPKYMIRLSDQARGLLAALPKIVPIILYEGETEIEDDTIFTRWAHRHRKLSSMYSLRDSKIVVDIRFERKLRDDFAKI